MLRKTVKGITYAERTNIAYQTVHALADTADTSVLDDQQKGSLTGSLPLPLSRLFAIIAAVLTGDNHQGTLSNPIHDGYNCDWVRRALDHGNGARPRQRARIQQ